MPFVYDGRSIVTAIDAKPKRTTSLQRLRNITANPAVSVLIDHYDDDWNRLWWARADGPARIRDAERGPNALDLLTAKYPQYREQRPDGPVIDIRVDRWVTWSAKRLACDDGSRRRPRSGFVRLPMVLRFEIVQSALSTMGQPSAELLVVARGRGVGTHGPFQATACLRFRGPRDARRRER
jgi:PPOX class probable F420-dependent enzyme